MKGRHPRLLPRLRHLEDPGPMDAARRLGRRSAHGLAELAKVKSGDVLPPVRSRQGEDQGTIRLRCVTEPDEAQKVILHRLGVSLPVASGESTKLRDCSGKIIVNERQSLRPEQSGLETP